MIFFLYGEDAFRSRQKLKALKDKFIKEIDPSGANLLVQDGEKSNLAQIAEALGAASLFVRKRMVVVENILLNKDGKLLDELKAYIEKNQNDSNIVIFWEQAIDAKKLSKSRSEWFKFLTGQKYAQEFKRLSQTEAAAWTKKEAEARGGRISGQAAVLLAALLNGDLWHISQDLDKLLNYKKKYSQLALIGSGIQSSASQIETIDVEDMVKGTFASNIFALTDAIGSKNKALAGKLLEKEQETGVADMQILNMVVRQFRILLQVREAIDQGMSTRKIMSQLKMQPFVVQKAITQVRNHSVASLKNLLNYLIKIDQSVKSGRGSASTWLSLMIAKM